MYLLWSYGSLIRAYAGFLCCMSQCRINHWVAATAVIGFALWYQTGDGLATRGCPRMAQLGRNKVLRRRPVVTVVTFVNLVARHP